MNTVDIYKIPVKTIEGATTTLEAYRHKTLLIVNVASLCGFTSQYTELENLYRKYNNQGLVILGFPCNQFAGQEPSDEAEIKKFCETHYQISFPLFAKINVNGPSTHPLYAYLKSQCKGFLGTGTIKWNFTKFLVDKHGDVCKRFAPAKKPFVIESTIKNYL